MNRTRSNMQVSRSIIGIFNARILQMNDQMCEELDE